MLDDSGTIAAARRGDEKAFVALVAPYRRELRAHCYRLSGSIHDADDLLQESLLKAWKAIAGFEGRSSVRTWLYRVATSACLDLAEKQASRTYPRHLGGPSRGDASAPPRESTRWIEPCPDDWIEDVERSPEARYTARESVAIAFLAALQLLPPKQRAVLVLCDVLGWQASECAEALGLTVASVNSALQRARAGVETGRGRSHELEDEATKTLLGKYLRAWESADLAGLVELLRVDVVVTMPPFDAWFDSADAFAAAVGPMAFSPGSAGNFRLRAITANGSPAVAVWQRDALGVYRASGIHVLGLLGGRVAELDAFLDPSLFAAFGLEDVRT